MANSPPNKSKDGAAIVKIQAIIVNGKIQSTKIESNVNTWEGIGKILCKAQDLVFDQISEKGDQEEKPKLWIPVGPGQRLTS